MLEPGRQPSGHTGQAFPPGCALDASPFWGDFRQVPQFWRHRNAASLGSEGPLLLLSFENAAKVLHDRRSGNLILPTPRFFVP